MEIALKQDWQMCSDVRKLQIPVCPVYVACPFYQAWTVLSLSWCFRVCNTQRPWSLVLYNPRSVRWTIVTSLTKMVRCYWSEFSHMPCDIIQCHIALMWHWIMSQEPIMHHCNVVIGRGAVVGIASHSWRDIIMLLHNYRMVLCQ